MGWLGFRVDLFGLITKRLIEAHQQPRPEAPCQGPARRVAQLADAPQPHPFQPGDGIGVQPQRRHGQIGQSRPLAVMRPRPSRPTRIAKADAHRQPCPAQTLTHGGKHRRLTPKEMRRAGDVQNQPVAPLIPDPRAPAHGPTAQPRQKAHLLIRTRRQTDQIGAEGPRIGKAHLTIEALPLGGFIQAMHAIGVAFLQRQDKGAVNRARPKNPVARQPGEPQRHDASLDPIEHSRPQLFLICS